MGAREFIFLCSAMYSIAKKYLFSKDPESAHHFVMNNMEKVCRIPGGKTFIEALYKPKGKQYSKEVFGLKFPNIVGLAAGFDKDAKYVDVLASLGFGFVEIGTLTPRPQPGNDKPRLFRLVEDEALINRMGFNNEGVDAAVERLKKRKSNIIVGGNIGKNKIIPNEKAIEDYEYCFRKLYDVVDYFVVNVSSPNTPGLRELQEKEPLQRLLVHLQGLNHGMGSPKPLLLKIAPDLGDPQLDDIVEIALSTQLAGIVATNTTIERAGLKTNPQKLDEIGAGGLSGKPLRRRSTEVIRYLKDKSQGKFNIIGVGGIHGAEEAQEKLDAGADLVQLYSGFIYEGPGLIKRIVQGTQP